MTGYCGAVVAIDAVGVTVEDRNGLRRAFPWRADAFLIDGQPVTLRRSASAVAPASARSASGSTAVIGAPARVARASRIWVEGIHDATLLERIWGHDLRVEGIVVEPIGGLDNLADAVRAFGPSPLRRVGVLADHLVPGSKESRIAETVCGPSVMVTGHPYIDIWQAVRPEVVGIPSWPDVPRGLDWKSGVCRALGVSDPATMWGRVNNAVGSYRDVETPLVTAVEKLIDFVTGAA